MMGERKNNFLKFLGLQDCHQASPGVDVIKLFYSSLMMLEKS
jgi:hypothetical protein